MKKVGIIHRLSMKCASGSMDRASDSGSEGWGFESLLAYQKAGHPQRGRPAFCLREGTRTIQCGSPVDCRQTPAGRRLLLNVPSPFWRTAPGLPLFWYISWDSKGRRQRSCRKKESGGLFFSPWESPFPFRRIPLGMWMKGKPPAVQPGYSGGLLHLSSA